MPSESTLLLATLFVIAAAAGWLFARFQGRDQGSVEPRQFNADYFRGVKFLLNEQPDKALEVFVRMAELDNDAVETHFALGNLFRRRGEVDKAIRIHQNLIARPNLGREHRDQALFALGEDYMRAGLFDRAERLFQQLSKDGIDRAAAIEKLTRIYEQQRDWGQAIKSRQALQSLAPEAEGDAIAHYYCEMAEQARLRKDYAGARQLLRKADEQPHPTLRSAVMRAELAAEQGEHREAIRLYSGVLEHDSQFITELLPRLAKVCAATGDPQTYGETLQWLLDKRPEIAQDIAIASILNGSIEEPVVVECVRRFFQTSDAVRALLEATGIEPSTGELDQNTLIGLASALHRIAQRAVRFRCEQCGFASSRFYWQCPGCNRWDTLRPVRRLAVEGLLDRH